MRQAESWRHGLRFRIPHYPRGRFVAGQWGGDTEYRALSVLFECVVVTISHTRAAGHVWMVHGGKGKNCSVGETLRLAARVRVPLIVLEHYGNHWHARCPTDDGGRILPRAVPHAAAADHLSGGALAAAEVQWREADENGWAGTSAGRTWIWLNTQTQGAAHDDAGGAAPIDLVEPDA